LFPLLLWIPPHISHSVVIGTLMSPNIRVTWCLLVTITGGVHMCTHEFDVNAI
jgi:hypothetical protein